MEEKAEQVNKAKTITIVTFFYLLDLQDRLEKMNTRQKPGTPLVTNE